MDEIRGKEIKYIEIIDNIRILPLPKKFPLYKSVLNIYNRNSIFEYEPFPDLIPPCKSIFWFAGKEKALYYKKDNTTIHTYYTKLNTTKLLIANNHNNFLYIKGLLEKSNLENYSCVTEIVLEKLPDALKEKFYKYNYLRLSKLNRILFEYCFAFGLISVQDQLMFSKLLLKLQEYKLIPQLKTMTSSSEENSDLYLRAIRQGVNIFDKFVPDSFKENKFEQRFSIYSIDINIVKNLCTLLSDKIDGYVYFDEPTIWHRKMKDTSEIAIFNPKNVIE